MCKVCELKERIRKKNFMDFTEGLCCYSPEETKEWVLQQIEEVFGDV